MSWPSWAGPVGLNAFVILTAGLAAAAELMSRYRDEPFASLLNRYAAWYLGINGAIALGVYQLFALGENGAPLLADQPVVNALFAGTGAMLVLRSKLFTVRSEDGKESSAGPAIAVDWFLTVLDRQIDRLRAAKRHDLVATQLNEVTNYAEAVSYFQMSLLSFQNLSEGDKSALSDVVEQYRDNEAWSDRLKTLAIGFAILTIAGEANFSIFVRGLKAHLSHHDQTAGAAGRPGGAAT